MRIIYVDESGSPRPNQPDPNYPIFVLAGCVFDSATYVNGIANAVCCLKFAHFGSDAPILHEAEIRKRLGPFGFKGNQAKQEAFLSELDDTLHHHVPEIIAVAAKPSAATHDLAISAIEELVDIAARTSNTRTHWIFERRGRREDANLETALTAIAQPDRHTWEFVPKSRGLPGLEMADMVARPIGLSVIRPGQPNRAVERIQAKLKLTVK